MRKASLILFLLFFLVSTAGAMDKLWLHCSVNADESASTCYVSQQESEPEFTGFTEVYNGNSWSDLASKYNTWMVEKAMGSHVKSHNLVLNTDLEFDGYNEKTSSCVSTVASLVLSSGLDGMSDNKVFFDGNGKSINHFCQESDGLAGFISSARNFTIKDVTFENAYVALNTANNTNYVGVVAASVESATISNVTVKNSTVHIEGNVLGNDYRAGILVGFATDATFKGDSLVNDKITGTSNGTENANNSVAVGGLTGYLATSSGASLMDSNDVSIQIDLPFGTKVAIGGLVGDVQLNGSDSLEILWNKVRSNAAVGVANADSLNLIHLSASTQTRARVGGVVGYVNQQQSYAIIEGNSVWGKILVDASSFGSSNSKADSASGIGGIAGYVNATKYKDANYYNLHFLNYNSSVGAVSVPNLPENSSDCYVGYVAGVILAVSSTTETYVRGNIHYSNQDKLVIRSAGYFGMSANQDVYGDHYTECEFNFRNAIYDGKTALLSESAEMALSGTVHKINAGGSQTLFYNPILLESDMHRRAFTHVLNSVSKEKNIYWENDDSNAGLPYITDKQTAFEIKLDARGENANDNSHQNDIYDSVDESMRAFYGEISVDTMHYFITFTDRNGRIPADFMKAYQANILGKYGLKETTQTDVGELYFAEELNATMVYKEDLSYGIMYDKVYDVVYNLPNGVGSNLVYAPGKLDSVSLFDLTQVVPRIYDVDKGKEYRATKGTVTCSSLTLEVSLYDDYWNFSRFLNATGAQNASLGDCNSDVQLTLNYVEASGNGVASVTDLSIVGDNARYKINAIPYGYGNGEKLVSVHEAQSVLGSYDSITTSIASQLEFTLANPGYELKSMNVEFWVHMNGNFVTVYNACRENGAADGCARFEKAPPYLSSVDSISAALAENQAVCWNVTLDSTNRIGLDSLIVALNKVVAMKPNLSTSSYVFVAIPAATAEVIHYNVTFLLPDSLTFYNPDITSEFVKEIDFHEGADNVMPSLPYSNDYCITGWSTKKLEAANDPIKKYGLRDYDADVFAQYVQAGQDTMYPVFVPAVLCAQEVDLDTYDDGLWGDYTDHRVQDFYRTVVNSLVGIDLNIAEFRNDVVVDTVYHKFGKSRSMLLNENNSTYALNYKPKDGFEVNSVVVSFDKNRSKDALSYIINADPGAILPSDLSGMVITVDMEMVNTVELAFTDTSAIYSGSAVRLAVETSEFAAGRDAVLSVYHLDAQGNVVDTVKTVAVEKTPYADFVDVLGLAPGEHFFRVELRDGLDSVASFTSHVTVQSGIAAAGRDVWQMVNLNAVNMDSIARDDDQIFYWWDETSDNGEFWQYKMLDVNEDVAPAQGFWYSTYEGRPLAISLDYEDGAFDTEWNLKNEYSGWNMVGNPHGWRVQVPDGLDIYRWNVDESQYRGDVEFLEPYEAVWVHVDKSKKATLAGEPVFVSDSAENLAKKPALAKVKNAENWTIQAILSDNRGHKDSWNVLGVGEPLEGYEPPLGMGELVNLSIKEGKTALAKSVKSVSAADLDSLDVEWTLSLAATGNRRGELSFEGLDEIATFGLHLYVTVDGKTTELTEGESLPVLLKTSASTATVRVTGKKLCLATVLNNLHTAQMGAKLNVGFTVSENLAGAPLVVDVLDMGGKVVSTYGSYAVSGANSVNLSAPKSGLYLLRVRVASQQTAGKILVK